MPCLHFINPPGLWLNQRFTDKWIRRRGEGRWRKGQKLGSENIFKKHEMQYGLSEDVKVEAKASLWSFHQKVVIKVTCKRSGNVGVEAKASHQWFPLALFLELWRKTQTSITGKCWHKKLVKLDSSHKHLDCVYILAIQTSPFINSLIHCCVASPNYHHKLSN